MMFASLLLPLAMSTAARAQEAKDENDLFRRAPWNASVGGGLITFEGDQRVRNSGVLDLRLGYDFTPRWTLEGILDVMPDLQKRSFDASDPHHASELGSDTYGVRGGADVLFHLRNTKDLHLDPYLAVGSAVRWYDKDVGHGDTVLDAMVGGGLFYHFNDDWALRGDARTGAGGHNFGTIWTAGVNYRWGTQHAPAMSVAGGDIDSDGDGLLDSEEAKLGTNPYDPDTDKDGLSDGDEVKLYHTDPLNPDTDLDGLKDGAEVLTYHTNPLDRDTDKGGVADGHEVIEDNTNPLDPKDDLQLFTLNIEFDYDKADLKPKYYDKLDVIVKVLQRDPAATARVEGHADKRPHSEYSYNIRLSERRAKSVDGYLVDVGGIDPARLTYKGYGYTRPVAPNDTEENMQKNRRTEIYIRPGNQQGGEVSTSKPMVVPEAAKVEKPADKNNVESAPVK
jgi:outer membrane protein OmpA-like peptidoglycan-associated protein